MGFDCDVSIEDFVWFVWCVKVKVKLVNFLIEKFLDVFLLVIVEVFDGSFFVLGVV